MQGEKEQRWMAEWGLSGERNSASGGDVVEGVVG